MYYDYTYILLVLPTVIFALIAQAMVKSRFATYSKVANRRGLTGKDVAQAILNGAGIYDVTIQPIQGSLTDNYDPRSKEVHLSESVYNATSIAAAGVAAHECGHAVQHKVGYSMLQLRSKLVPVVSFASNTVQWLLLAGIMLVQITPIPLYVAIALFASTVLFSFVTLPVEVDASRRAIKWLEGSGIVNGQQLAYAKDALHAAAYTYVVGAIGSLATLLYYIAMIFGGNRR